MTDRLNHDSRGEVGALLVSAHLYIGQTQGLPLQLANAFA